MNYFLIHRPIAVLMSLLALVVFSAVALWQLPISLLPDTDVPRLTIRVSYAGHSPAEIEENVLRPIRENLATLSGLEELESEASGELGLLRLRFDFGTQMSLAYIEVNERIDRLTAQLPNDLPRPQVIRLSVSDIPVIRVHVVPLRTEEMPVVSDFTRKVIKKRLEQLEEVSLVDLHGLHTQGIAVFPDVAMLRSAGLDESALIQAIVSQNTQIGGISVKDGQYRYYLKISNPLRSAEDIAQLPLRMPSGQMMRVEQVARVEARPLDQEGMHIFEGQEGVVINVHKQPKARLTDLIPKVEEAVAQFQQDYPGMQFTTSRNQSTLLTAGIGNLQTSLLYGGCFAFLVLFIFMGNYRLPLIMGITLPLSVMLSFLLFYLFGLSLNIISLSGLALGLGMLIDNAIVILDNITRLRREGHPLVDACVIGTRQVMSALFSSMLTTLAVFVPLVFLSGISGALFFDQAVSVAIILGVSLALALVLLPLLYRLFFERYARPIQADTRIFTALSMAYDRAWTSLGQRPMAVVGVSLMLIPLGYGLFRSMPVQGLPTMEQRDLLLEVDWREPLTLEENRTRIDDLVGFAQNDLASSQADLGISGFLLQAESEGVQTATVYFLLSEQTHRQSFEAVVSQWIHTRYPMATISLTNAPNAFDRLFVNEKPYLEARLSPLNSTELLPTALLDSLADALSPRPELHAGTSSETTVNLSLHHEAIRQYGVEVSAVKEALKKLFSDLSVSEIRQFGENLPIYLKTNDLSIEAKLKGALVQGKDQTLFPLHLFVSHGYATGFREIAADVSGPYQSVVWGPDANAHKVQENTRSTAGAFGLQHRFTGRWFDDQRNIRELIFILGLSVLLLYFILAAQFESFRLPLIVMFTMPLGIAGSLLFLWISGTSVNIMSGIGIIIMLGIMVNDAILKIDTIKRLQSEGMALADALHQAGHIRLKPILMTSATTLLALMPILFTSGIGADLQKPLVYAVMGGLTIGTLTALFFIPMAYRLMEAPKK
jgi:multidrug efflux pump subunit AcrB